EHNNEHQDGDHDAHASAEGQSPAKHENEQAEVARVANDTVKPGGDQPVSRLDGDQPAEAPPEHEHRRQAKNAADQIEDKAQPAHALPAKGEKVDPVRIGG